MGLRVGVPDRNPKDKETPQFSAQQSKAGVINISRPVQLWIIVVLKLPAAMDLRDKVSDATEPKHLKIQ